jgi:hypothetical protein
LSAYFGSLLWQVFFKGDQLEGPQVFIPAWHSARTLLAPLMGRWLQEDRRRLSEQPGLSARLLLPSKTYG